MKEQKKSNIKKLFLSFGIFLVLCLYIDFVIGTVLNVLYFKQKSGLEYRTTYSIKKTKADVIVFGSSRANHHYAPYIFEKILNHSFYNAGRDGSSIFYNYAILKGILKRYRPKIIVLDILKEELGYKQQWYDRLSQLLPYYTSEPEIRDIINLKSPYEKFKLISKIYPYNSSLFTILIGNTEYNEKRHPDLNGYIPLFKNYRGSLTVIGENPKDPIDNNKIEIYKAFVDDCKNKNIKLFIVVSPFLLKDDRNNTIPLAKEIAANYHVPFWDFSEDSIFLKKTLFFADPEHLNDSGAHVFSTIIAERIKKDLK